MKSLPTADNAALADFFSRQPSQKEIEAVDALTIDPITMLSRPDLVVHSLASTLAVSIAAIFEEVAAVAGEEAAKEIAFRFGVRHGRTGLKRFLDNNKLPGGPEAFARWQDLLHSMRGPKHATALFARYDDKSVELTRSADAWNTVGKNAAPYAHIQVQGVVKGYQEIDRSLISYSESRTDPAGNPVGLFQRFVFA